MKVVWLGIGGAAGTLARYAMNAVVADHGHRGAVPLGTFVINVSGAFLVGLLTAIFAERFVSATTARLALTTGFLGAYTTFSTYMLQTMRLAEDGHPARSLLYLVGSVVAGLLAVVAGTWVGRSL